MIRARPKSAIFLNVRDARVKMSEEEEREAYCSYLFVEEDVGEF